MSHILEETKNITKLVKNFYFKDIQHGPIQDGEVSQARETPLVLGHISLEMSIIRLMGSHGPDGPDG